MKIQKVTNEQDILDAGGGYVLTAEFVTRERDNAIINVLVEMMHTLARCGEVSDELANSFGRHYHGNGESRYFVYLPDDEFALRSLNKEDRI
jgi:hypothetical protein